MKVASVSAGKVLVVNDRQHNMDFGYRQHYLVFKMPLVPLKEDPIHYLSTSSYVMIKYRSEFCITEDTSFLVPSMIHNSDLYLIMQCLVCYRVLPRSSNSGMNDTLNITF